MSMPQSPQCITWSTFISSESTTISDRSLSLIYQQCPIVTSRSHHQIILRIRQVASTWSNSELSSVLWTDGISQNECTGYSGSTNNSILLRCAYVLVSTLWLLKLSYRGWYNKRSWQLRRLNRLILFKFFSGLFELTLSNLSLWENLSSKKVSSVSWSSVLSGSNAARRGLP